MSPLPGRPTFFVPTEMRYSSQCLHFDTSGQKDGTEESQGGDGKYDRILGEGEVQEVLNCIGMRFNMDGSPIPGRKVGLLAKHYPW